MSILKPETTAYSEYFNTDHLNSDLRKQALRGTSLTVISQIINYGTQTVGTIVLARLLTPNDFGLVMMVVAFSLLIQNFGTSGFSEVIIQRKDIHHLQISTLFWINAGLSLILTLIFLAATPLIVRFYNEPRLTSIAILIAPSIILSGLSTQHQALLKRNMKFYHISAIEVAATFITFAIAIAMAFWGWGYWSLVTRWVVGPLAITVGAWILCRWRPGLPVRGTGVRSMLGFTLNTYGNFVTDYFRRNIDKILIGRFYGSEQLGSYDRAFHLSLVFPQLILTPLSNVALATFSRVSHIPEKYRSTYLTVLSFLSFISMPFSAVVSLVSSDLVLLLLGPQWYKTSQILFVLGLSIGVSMIYSTHGWLHLSLNTPDRWFRWGILAFIITILSFAIGFRFGALGIAIAYSVSSYLLIGPGLWYAGRPINLKLSTVCLLIWRDFVAAVTAGILSWLILHVYGLTSSIFMALNIVERIVVSTGLCVFIYLILIVALYQSWKPISQFISLFREMFPKISFGK